MFNVWFHVFRGDILSIPFPQVMENLGRPFVFVNCASSADGKLALPDGRQTRISSDDDIAFVYRLRNWSDAVIVGINTVLKDDPKLTVKEKYVTDSQVSQPLRVVVDSCCRTPPGSEILNESASTLIAVTEDHMGFQELPDNVDILACGVGEQVNLALLLDDLWNRGVRKIMVEGGGTLIASFLKEGLVDEFLIFIGDMIIGGEMAPTPAMGQGASDVTELVRLERYGVFPLKGGVRMHYRVKNYRE